jgi:creatinine deaminase
MDDQGPMDVALAQAQKSYAEGGVPVGAALTQDGKVIAAGHNRRVQDGDPIAHGEMDCIRKAGRKKSLKDLTLYTTLCPCMMCSGTIVQFKVARVVIGDDVNFSGSIPFLRSQGIEVAVLNDPRCVALMREFITRFPELWNEDIGNG